MTINDRINQIIEAEHLTVASLARRLEIGDQTVRSVCVLHRNKPSFEFINKLIHAFEWLNPRWLITGEGEMRIPTNEGHDSPSNTTTSRDIESILEYMHEKDIRIDEYLKAKDQKIEDLLIESTTWRVRYEELSRGYHTHSANQ